MYMKHCHLYMAQGQSRIHTHIKKGVSQLIRLNTTKTGSIQETYTSLQKKKPVQQR